jgi:hypothetical protein
MKPSPEEIQRLLDELVAAPTQRTADAIVMHIDFAEWPEEAIEHVIDLINAKPGEPRDPDLNSHARERKD